MFCSMSFNLDFFYVEFWNYLMKWCLLLVLKSLHPRSAHFLIYIVSCWVMLELYANNALMSHTSSILKTQEHLVFWCSPMPISYSQHFLFLIILQKWIKAFIPNQEAISKCQLLTKEKLLSPKEFHWIYKPHLGQPPCPAVDSQ